MKKKIFLAVIFSVLLIAVNAFAQSDDLEYAHIYTVGANGDTAPKDVFTLGAEKPWLFLQFDGSLLPADTIGKTWTISNWIWDESAGLPYLKVKGDTLNGVWLAFSDSKWHDVIEEAGNWSISVGSSLELADGSTDSYSGTAKFKVAVIPEPASTALFILGAAAFGFGIARKKTS